MELAVKAVVSDAVGDEVMGVTDGRRQPFAVDVAPAAV